jgi:GxxExxY protein
MVFEGKHSDVTDNILNAFFKVYNQLGFGFSEKVYENALVIELSKHGLLSEVQKEIYVYYESAVIGEYVVDVLVDKKVILELKAVKRISDDHHAQLLNYLKASTIEVGLLLNFGLKPEYIRKVFDNNRKGNLSWIKSRKKNKNP